MWRAAGERSRYDPQGNAPLSELMNPELVALRQLGSRSGRMEGSERVERGGGGGGSVVEAWLKGVSMVGLPRNLMLLPDAGKPSSKTGQHTHRHRARDAHGPKDRQTQSSEPEPPQILTRTQTRANHQEAGCFLFLLCWLNTNGRRTPLPDQRFQSITCFSEAEIIST